MSKERLDKILVDRGLFESREKARASIMAGNILVDGQREDKAGAKFSSDVNVEVKESLCPFVSRGGLKLKKAIEYFNIDLNGVVAADVGASTGGFTDCMLKYGTSKVFAIDVGYGQLAWVLRNDHRVVCMERFNARYLKKEDIGELLDFASVDVSFISLSKIIPALSSVVREEGKMVTLIKPQFEAGRDKVGKHGVVRDPKVHIDVIQGIINIFQSMGLNILGLTYSPVTGPEGNIEYLLYVEKSVHNEAGKINNEIRILDVVEGAHDELGFKSKKD